MTSSDPSSKPSANANLNPSASPLPLSASQESQVRELYHKRVRNKCMDEVKDFATCATNRTFTATIACRPQRKAMNNCMLQFATQAEQDAARKEWFESLDKRKEERVAKEEKRVKDEKFWREWWDKDLAKKPGQQGNEKE